MFHSWISSMHHQLNSLSWLWTKQQNISIRIHFQNFLKILNSQSNLIARNPINEAYSIFLAYLEKLIIYSVKSKWRSKKEKKRKERKKLAANLTERKRGLPRSSSGAAIGCITYCKWSRLHVVNMAVRVYPLSILLIVPDRKRFTRFVNVDENIFNFLNFSLLSLRSLDSDC